MRLFVKICGVTTTEIAETCAEEGVDAVGFVFADSPRRVTPEQAAKISARLPPGIAWVAVFRRPDIGDVRSVLAGFAPDLVQADHDTLTELGEARLLPVFHEGGAAPDGGRFLYEGPVSGVGRMVDLSKAAGVARLGEMILAGGLRPENVGEAIARARPFGVDVSSGVETSPGVKGPELIRSFVEAVRTAEERLVRA